MIIEVFPPGIKGFVLSIQALIIQGVSLNYHMYLEGFGVGVGGQGGGVVVTLREDIKC